MITYVPVLVWILSALICLYIAKQRNVKVTLFWKITAVVLGPFAIPLVFFAKSVNPVQVNQ